MKIPWHKIKYHSQAPTISQTLILLPQCERLLWSDFKCDSQVTELVTGLLVILITEITTSLSVSGASALSLPVPGACQGAGEQKISRSPSESGFILMYDLLPSLSPPLKDLSVGWIFGSLEELHLSMWSCHLVCWSFASVILANPSPSPRDGSACWTLNYWFLSLGVWLPDQAGGKCLLENDPGEPSGKHLVSIKNPTSVKTSAKLSFLWFPISFFINSYSQKKRKARIKQFWGKEAQN